jgi:hypothetical protein
MKRFFSIIIIFFAVVHLNAQSVSDFPSWLLGCWEIKSETGSSFEEWKQDSNGSLSGRTYRLFMEDTIVFDTMRIRFWDDEIVYQMSANVKNTRVYARYPLQRPDPVLWKFENPLTDYPRNINYMRMGNDTVYVWTEASDANNACMDYLMIKTK